MDLNYLSKVPSEIFELEPIDRVNNYFLKVSVEHSKFQNIYRSIIDYSNYKDDKIIFVIGPTGIGKTHLADKFLRTLCNKPSYSNGTFKHQLPILFTVAGSSGTGFNWPFFYRSAIQRFNVDQFIRTNSIEQSTKANYGAKFKASGKNSAELQQELIQRIIDYEVKHWLIDEAGHIFKYSGKSGDNDLNTLKYIADQSGVRITLFGLYEATAAIGEIGQINRRIKLFGFDNYEPGSRDFVSAYVTLLTNIPFQLDSDLTSDVDYVYAGCCGCVGILRDWLLDAQKLMISSNDNQFSLKYLKGSKLTNSSLIKIAKEIRDHNLFMKDDGIDEVLRILSDGESLHKSKIDNSKTKQAKKSTTKKRQGVPDPVRTPIKMG